MHEKMSMDQLGRMSVEEFRNSGKFPVILILDNIRSGLNVGSIFRSADAFRIEKIYCCGYTATPPHREVLKSALGATESVAWEASEDCVEVVKYLRQNGIDVFCLEQTTGSIPLDQFNRLEKLTAFVLGNEVHGVSPDVIAASSGTLEIAQHGTKHSLNVAVCAGIVLFQVINKLQPSGKD